MRKAIKIVDVCRNVVNKQDGVGEQLNLLCYTLETEWMHNTLDGIRTEWRRNKLIRRKHRMGTKRYIGISGNNRDDRGQEREREREDDR